MPGWELGAGTFVISAVSAYVFLRLRCRGIGYPFGPRARWWALVVVLMTAIAATGLGEAAVAISDNLGPVYIAVLIPSTLWLGKWSAPRSSRRGAKLARTLIAAIGTPLRRLDDSMGDDLQSWCDVRAAVVSTSPELIYDAAEHYYIQVVNQVKDPQKHRDLETWLGSIKHKVAIARQLRLETTRAAVLREHLQDHPSTRGTRKYAADDAIRLARRLESDARSEFALMLGCIYRLGHRKLVTYRGYRPMPQVRRAA